MKLRMETRLWIASASIAMDMSEILSTYPIQPAIRLKWKIIFISNLQYIPIG